MICDGDIRAARDLRDLLELARSGDRIAAKQLRKAQKWLTARLGDIPAAHELDAWLADRGLPVEAVQDFQDSGLPLLPLELGWRRAALAARPAPPSIEAVLEAAYASDHALQTALADAKKICRRTLNELHLSATPDIGAIVIVGRRRLELVAVSAAGRLTWRDINRRDIFTSSHTGRLRHNGRAP